MARHSDFEKIYATFMQHFSKDSKLGEERYLQWLKDSCLDETRGYYEQGAERAQSRQSFAWADFLLHFVKEDKDAKYYEVEALFPVESMNKDSPPFTRDEVLQAARTLTGKPSDLNHDHSQMLEGVEVVAAQFEDDCVECLVRVPKTSALNGMIERKEIVSVSIEGEWSHGLPGQGLVLTGLGWLTKKTSLPGIPLTRIVPVERIVECFEVKAQVLECFKAAHKGKMKLAAGEGEGVPACSVCGAPADFLVSICQPCLDKASGSQGNGSEKMEEKDIESVAEKVAAKVSEKNSQEIETLKSQLSEANGKLATVEAELTEKKTMLTEAEGKLAQANSTVEKLKQLVPGVDLLADPPKLMPVSEALERLARLELPKMQERLSLGNQLQAQKVRREIFEVKQKYGVA